MKKIILCSILATLTTSCGIADFIAKNPKLVKAIGITALGTVAVVGATEWYKHSDNFFQRAVIGGPEIRDTKPVTLENAKEITINNNLKGYRYNPQSSGIFDGKYVIFYSGSGSSNTYQVANMIDKYTKEGATIIGVDYEGFGNSGKRVSSGKVREKGIYSNAQTIYDYVHKDLGIKSENIIIHGFSLGGPVAAYVAANVSKKGDKINQLILQSSMKNTTNAAYGSLSKRNKFVQIVGSTGAYLFADNFDCEKDLKRLYKFYPDIHLVICGGNDEDGLNLKRTKLDNFAKKQGFKNLVVFNGTEGHLKDGGAPIENFKSYDDKKDPMSCS